MRILFDADSMVYGCGFATQRTLYDYTLASEDGSEIVEGIAQGKDELEAVVAMLPDGWSIGYETRAEAEPLENALALVKRQLTRVSEKLDRDGYRFERLELFITGKGNFREQIAKVRPYKGNRILMEKPVHYHSIRRYLSNRWMARTINGWEADDEVAMQAALEGYDPSQVMIVSQDKDLRTVPGLLFNYRSNAYEMISQQAALVNFYRQIITGDATDNIVGVHKAGPAKAVGIITTDMTETDMWNAVVQEFAASMEKKGCPYADRDPADVALETARLLHMARRIQETLPGGWWRPPHERT